MRCAVLAVQGSDRRPRPRPVRTAIIAALCTQRHRDGGADARTHQRHHRCRDRRSAGLRSLPCRPRPARTSPRRIGRSISAAPCAVAIRKDHSASCVGRIRASHARMAPPQQPATCRTAAPARPRRCGSRGSTAASTPSSANGTSTSAIASEVAGAQRQQGREHAPAPRLSLRPSATASGQPMAGFRPW